MKIVIGNNIYLDLINNFLANTRIVLISRVENIIYFNHVNVDKFVSNYATMDYIS